MVAGYFLVYSSDIVSVQPIGEFLHIIGLMGYYFANLQQNDKHIYVVLVCR